MPAIVAMPKLGMTMTEGTVKRWLKGEGQQVEKGAPLMEIETEKIVYEVEAPCAGLLHIANQEGSVVPCGGICGMVAVSQEEYQALTEGRGLRVEGRGRESSAQQSPLHPPPSSRVIASPAARRLAQELGIDIFGLSGTGPEGRIVEDDVRKAAEAQKTAEPTRVAVSPVAHKMAEEHGVDLSKIAGSGPEGRIIRQDILAAMEKQTAPPRPLQSPESSPSAAPGQRRVAKTIPLTGMRKAIADHMVKSLQSSAQLTCITDVDATALGDLHHQLMAEAKRIGARVSHNDLIAAALVRALKGFPVFNSTVEGDEIQLFGNVNLGFAVPVEDGLIVPVVHDADKLSLVELSNALAALAEKARNRSLSFHDVTGGTFTVSNLSAFDVMAFTPIINSPESAILGVGGMAERPAVVRGQLTVRSTVYLSLTWDHRVADGVLAAKFLRAIRQLLERPSVLLV